MQGGSKSPLARLQAILWTVDTHFLVVQALEIALPEVLDSGGAEWVSVKDGMKTLLSAHKNRFQKALDAEKARKAH